MAALLWRVYARLGELEQTLHRNASALALGILAIVSAVLGILQSSELIPVFNQFGFFAAIAAIWGLCLMIADRRIK